MRPRKGRRRRDWKGNGKERKMMRKNQEQINHSEKMDTDHDQRKDD